MKTMSKSAKKLFIAAACISMLLVCFAGCNQLNGGGEKKTTEQQKPNTPNTPNTPNNPTDPQKSSEKQLLEFKFEKKNNTGLGLSEDIVGTVDELSKMVDMIVPNSIDITKLKASFVLSKAASASVKGTPQESGKTKNDFTKLVYYTITAEGGSKEEYVVHVEKTPVSGTFSGKKIFTFGFRENINPELSKDVEGIVGTNKLQTKGFCFIKFPAGTTEATIKSLKPTFTASAKAELFIDGVKLESSKTAANFYDLVKGTNITVKAENGGLFTYNVAVEVDLPKADRYEVEKYFGSYYGVLESTYLGKNDVVVVLEANKVIIYSTAMSMDYVNVEWERKTDGTYTCTTYRKMMPQIKNMYGKGGYDFTEEGGKTIVKTNIMGTPVTLTKGEDFTWTEGSKYKKITYHI